MWIVLSLIKCPHEVFRFLLQARSYTDQSWKHSNKNTKNKNKNWSQNGENAFSVEKEAFLVTQT